MEEGRFKAALEGLERYGGEDAQRAGEMLQLAAEASSRRGVRWSEVVAYGVRESLETVPAIFGVPAREHDLRTPLATALEGLRKHVADPSPGIETLRDLTDQLAQALSESEASRRDRVARAMANQLGREHESRELDRFAGKWSETLGRANQILHGDPHIPEEAESLLAYAVDLVAALVGRMSSRLDELDQLLVIEDPTDRQIERLLVLLADPRHANYFYTRARSHGWLEALNSRGEFEGPIEGDWYQGELLVRASPNSPDLAQEIASRLTSEVHPFVGPAILAVARHIGQRGVGLAVEVLERPAYSSPWVMGHELGELIESYATGGVASALQRLADAALDLHPGERDRDLLSKFDKHDFPRVVGRFVRLTPCEDLLDLAKVLAFKLRRALKILQEEEFQRLNLDRALIDGGGEDNYFLYEAPQVILSGLRDSLRRLRDCGVALADRRLVIAEDVEKFEVLKRLWASHLGEEPDITAGESDELLQNSMREGPPNPETLKLLRIRMQQFGDLQRSGILQALGGIPEPERVRQWAEDETFHRNLLRQWKWLGGITENLPVEWQPAFEVMVQEFGEPDREGRLFRTSTFVGSPSPLSAGEISSLGPAGLVDWLSRWSPPTGGWREPTPEGLSIQLSRAVSQSPHEWVAALPDLVGQLRHPIYVRGVLSGLAEAVGQGTLGLDWQRVVSAAELVFSEPWPAEPLPATHKTFDTDWRSAIDAVLRVLETGVNRDAPVGQLLERIWRVFEGMLQRRTERSGVDGRDFLTAAINKPSTRALDALFSLVGFAHRQELEPDAWNARLVATIDEQMNAGEEERQLSVAIIARRFSQLVAWEPERAKERLTTFFGGEESESLRIESFEDVLTWAHASGQVIELLRGRLWAYLSMRDKGIDERPVMNAVDWETLAYIWRLSPLIEADEFIGRLGKPERVSEAAELYGRVLKNTGDLSEEVLARALAFWNSLLGDSSLEPSAFAGLGWWAEARIPDNEWLSRTRLTLERAKGRIDWDHEVVARMKKLYSKPDAWESLTLLVKGAANPWDLTSWSKDLHEMFSSDDLAVGEVATKRRELIEALLEREMMEFRKYLDNEGSA